MIGDVRSFFIVVRVCREWLGALRQAGEAIVRVGSLFRRKAWRGRDCFFQEGGEVMSTDKIFF